MSCQIVQAQLPNNEAEKAMFAFLKHLPAGYTLYSELRVNTDFDKQVEGLRERKPDFVVVGEDVGVVAVEVKDWNLDRFTYEWQDQRTVHKLDPTTRKVIANDIDNPGAQVAAYLYALTNLLKTDRIAGNVWVTSLLAFPRLTRQEFLNGTQDLDILTGDPQAKFYVDLDRIIFREALDRYADHPAQLLTNVVERDRRFRKPSRQEIHHANEVLMPPKFRVGGDVKLQAARQRVETLTRQQQEWAFSLDPSANYLLDVAGSGKTNALISKAIHLVDLARGPAPTILITTYNRNLEKGLRRVFLDKVGTKSAAKYQAVQILSVPSLLELVVDKGLGEGAAQSIRKESTSEEAYVEGLLRYAREILRADPDGFARFDHVFIDEIQDFSDAFLRIVKRFARGDSYFFVGDIAQKIYDRQYDLQRLGLTLNRRGIDASYKMYRTPRYIAELATAFVLSDSAMRKEFAEHGYSESYTFSNPIENAAVIRREPNAERAAAALIAELLATAYPGGEHHVLVVASADRLNACQSALLEAGVHARIGEEETADAVTVVDFSDSKGLEREVVVVVGVEDLYARGQTSGVFDSVTEQIDREARNRRKVYVALTRAMERLYVLYSDRSHPFVQQLCDLNERIERKRLNR
jgi:superfamily I DNA/RNA helicase